jgi:colanic acid/amylovoran biosynthesis protein
MAEVTTKLIQLKNCHVVFLSTNTSLGGHPTDDRKTAGDVLALLDPAIRTQTSLIRGEYRPEEIKALYSQMTLHMGTRMHSVILAAAARTPVVGVAYEFKMFGVMRSLGLEEYVCDIEDMTEEELWRKVCTAIDRREQLRENVAKALPVLQTQARRNAQLIADMLRYHSQPVSHRSVVKSV